MVLKYEKEISGVTVPGNHGCKIRAETEDVRNALRDESFAEMIHQENDQLDNDISYLLSHVASSFLEM